MSQKLSPKTHRAGPSQKRYSKYQGIGVAKELIFRQKKSPRWAWLLMAVIAIDSLLAATVWFAVGYIVQ